MKNEQSLVFALGLAQKAGQAVSGDFAVQEALRKGKVKLLVIAKDASDNSRKRLINFCGEHGITRVDALDRMRLGWALGKGPRTAVAIMDNNFVRMIMD